MSRCVFFTDRANDTVIDARGIRVKLRAMQAFRCALLGLLSGLLFSLLLVTTVMADDLFVAQTPVTDEDSETRNGALKLMLADVLIRVSGSTGIASQPGARVVLDAAPSLVQQYRYETSQRGEAIERVLWARFEQGSVERMMREQGLPVWSQRPRVLLWLATERASQRALLNLDAEPQALTALRTRADYRGMPLQLPLMDLEDQAGLTPADVWSGYQPGIRQASARYPHDLVVTGRLQAQSGNRWRGAWTIFGRDGEQTFETPAQPLDDALAFAVDQVQNLLAARYAPTTGLQGASGTLVRFANVSDLAAYGRLTALLQGLAPVSHVALRDAVADALYLELRLRGSEEDLQRALDASAEVIFDPGGTPLPERVVGSDGRVATQRVPQADLYYRLRN